MTAATQAPDARPETDAPTTRVEYRMFREDGVPYWSQDDKPMRETWPTIYTNKDVAERMLAAMRKSIPHAQLESRLVTDWSPVES